MKKTVIILSICLSTSSAFASIFCSHTININNNFSISINFQDFYKSKITAGLYFDLIVWAKNVENKLANVNGRIAIGYDNDNNIIIDIVENDIYEAEYRIFFNTEKDSVEIVRFFDENNYIADEKYFWNRTEGTTKFIIAKLNAIYKANGSYNNLNTIELFVKNNKKNEAKHVNAKIFSDYIYINKEELIKNIKEEKDDDYFIETIRINRRDVDNIVEISSWLCG